MKTSLKTTLVFFLLAFSAAQIFAQDTYNLNYKFEKGKTYFYRFNMNSGTVQNVMGQEQNINMLYKGKINVAVSDIMPAQIAFLASYDSLYSKLSDPSGDKETNGEGLVGKKVKSVFDKTGKLIKRTEIDPIESSQLSNLTAYMFPIYQLTEKPVKAGDTWNTVSSDTAKQGEDGKRVTKSNTEYKVVGMEKYNGIDCLKISESSTLKTEGGMTQNGMNIVFEGTGKTVGLFYFDVSKGVIAWSENKTEMDLTASVPDMNMTIPINIKMNSTLLLLEK